MDLSDATRSEIVAHYRTHEATYQRIWGQLDTIRERFKKADRETKKDYLKLSYVNSVISVQTPLHIHEEAFRRILSGDGLERALERVNYNGQKKKYLSQCLQEPDIWETLVTDYNERGLDTMHKTAIDRLKFVGTVKVPFMLANLGFTEKMCLDANVCRIMGIDSQPTTVVVDRYESLCTDVCDLFPVLEVELDPYHLQWVLFDYQRFNRTNMDPDTANRLDVETQVAHHEAWFDGALMSEPELNMLFE